MRLLEMINVFGLSMLHNSIDLHADIVIVIVIIACMNFIYIIHCRLYGLE